MIQRMKGWPLLFLRWPLVFLMKRALENISRIIITSWSWPPGESRGALCLTEGFDTCFKLKLLFCVPIMLACSSMSIDLACGIGPGDYRLLEREKFCLVCRLSPSKLLISRAFETKYCRCFRTCWLLFVMFMYGIFAPSSSTFGNSIKLRDEAETEESLEWRLDADLIWILGLGIKRFGPCRPGSMRRRWALKYSERMELEGSCNGASLLA